MSQTAESCNSTPFGNHALVNNCVALGLDGMDLDCFVTECIDFDYFAQSTLISTISIPAPSSTGRSGPTAGTVNTTTPAGSAQVQRADVQHVQIWQVQGRQVHVRRALRFNVQASEGKFSALVCETLPRATAQRASLQCIFRTGCRCYVFRCCY